VLIGRRPECARIDALLEAARRGRAGAFVLSGEPGIGKTALLDEACARAAGMRVLRVTGVESESALPFAALHSLLRPLLTLLPRLEAPQERSLRLALALDDGDEPDLLAVSAGTLGVLAEAAAEHPLFVAVDDAHWLDAPSAEALAFAARRLAAEAVAFVVGARADEVTPFDHGLERLELEPLERDDARELLRQRREAVPPEAVERMLDLADGNPLAVLELPLAFAVELPEAETSAPLRLRRAFAARLESLAPPERQALLLAAAEPDPAAVRRAAEELGVVSSALTGAEEAGLVHVRPEGVAFRHPLVRSLAYASASPAERRAAHRALAHALPADADQDRRAWHLAAAATERDETLAALLEETAARATQRGGHAAAARALERSARLTAERDAAARRLTRAARATFWAGDRGRALQLADEAFDSTEDVILRADALLERAAVVGPETPLGRERLEDMLDEIDNLDPVRVTRLLQLLVSARGNALDAAGAAALGRRLEAVSREADEWWKPRGLATAAAAFLSAGDGDGFERLFAELADDDAPLATVALDLIWAERYDVVRRALERTLSAGRSDGNRIRIVWNQACLAHLELRLGRLAQARAAAAESITVGDAQRLDGWAAIARAALAGVHAWQGNRVACTTLAEQAAAGARAIDAAADEFAAIAALGLLELGSREPDAAIDVLLPAAKRWAESSVVEPSSVPFVPDLVEAYAQVGETEHARRWLARFGAAAERSKRRWALAAVARCEGVLAEDSDGCFERALALLERSPLALERARTQLVYGEKLRRSGRRREARAHLQAAHAAFALVDATPWVERAAAEVRATGATVGSRAPDRMSQLTPQELQIAHLVAVGQTNKEIATQLYLSPKTIEYHLANTYRKLEVHSRVELTRVLAAPLDLT
jgi:DNA-binding CsgD family transcriptional regulator